MIVLKLDVEAEEVVHTGLAGVFTTENDLETEVLRSFKLNSGQGVCRLLYLLLARSLLVCKCFWKCNMMLTGGKPCHLDR